MGVRMRAVLPWHRLARTLALTASLGIALWFAKAQLPWPAGARFGISFVAFGVAYVILARRLGILTRGDLAYLTRWLSFRLR